MLAKRVAKCVEPLAYSCGLRLGPAHPDRCPTNEIGPTWRIIRLFSNLERGKPPPLRRSRPYGPWCSDGPSSGWSPEASVVGRRLPSGHPSPRRASAAGGQGDEDRGFGEKQHAPPHAAHEKGRGREADTPTEIPARGWKDILWRTYEEFQKDRIMSVAAGVTYYALLAVFPAIAALVSIYGLFSDPSTIQNHLSALSGVLPGGGVDIIREQVVRIASQGSGTLGFGFVFGLGLSLWSANAGMKAIFDALNIVYDEEEKRSFIALNLLSLTFTLGAIFFILSALVAIVVLPDRLQLHRARHADGMDPRHRPMAASPGRHRAGTLRPLSLRPEPRQSRMALGHARRHRGRGSVDCRLDAVLLVCGQFRQLQRDSTARSAP